MAARSPRNPGFRLKPITAAILCSGGLVSFAAQAQTEPQAAATSEAKPAADAVQLLAPVKVTGETQPLQPALASPKFTAPLLDTPQTVAVIPEVLFRQQGAQDLTDVLSNTPGISFNAGENGFSSGTGNFSLRGVDTSGSIFIDGARDSGNYSRDVFNLEQVEVVKGPAADNGRGGAGGYINLVTKTPHLQNAYNAGISYGFDQYDADGRGRGTADLNQVVGKGAAVRLNVLGQAGGVPGREEARKRGIGFAPSLALGLDGDTRYILSYQYLDQNDRPDWGVPAAFIDGMEAYDPSISGKDRANFYGLLSDHDDVTAHSLTGRVEHAFSSDLKLSNQLRWARTQREARYTVPTGYNTGLREVTTQRQAFERENVALSNVTNLSYGFATGSLRHQLAAGLEISREESESGRFTTSSGGVTGIDNPDPLRDPGTAITRTQTAAAEIDTIALYLYDTVQFSEKWQLTGGVRGERYKASLDSRSLAGAPLGGDDFEVSETTVGGKLGVVYKPSTHGTLYAAVGLSSLPPGSFLSNPDISREGDNALPGLTGVNAENAKVQRALNYEVGAKWDFLEERLSTAVAVFHTQRKNVAITGREAGETTTTLKGYGEQIVQGIELSANGRIGTAWNVFAGAAFMETERQHSAFLDEVRCRANPGDYLSGAPAGDCTTIVSGPLGTDGDELAFSPKFSANLWVTYRFPFGLTLGGGGQHVGEAWLGRPDDAERIIPNAKADLGKLPDYTVLNAMASYEATPQMTVRLNVDNLGDELYAKSANWNGSRVLLGDARSVLLSIDYRF